MTTGSLDLVVTSVRWEADDVISITFADPAGGDLPEWRPGAHLELVLPSGLVRQYSLCGSPGDRSEYRVAVLREANGRGGSRELHDTGLVGKRLKVDGPRNRFELVPSSRYVFIAGGIGITPILAMVRSLATSVPWSLHYGGRTHAGMAFTDELVAIGGDRITLSPQDKDGLLDVDAIVGGADESTAIYCCGPAPLLEAVQAACARLVPGASLHIERFSAASAVPKAPGDERTVEVELRRSGVTVEVGRESSILDAIREVVPGAPYSCTEGYCGSCEVTVLEGTPDHRDDILTTEERETGRTMFPCVSRALSERLVLDI
ncbi:PDR/VanB family oxidoreductase [Amycolatopsis pithecellobii]|uniref:2Fe-2S iron-sulfur cluster binding domain-containing protein n=1 Tax=Amycolatopsis pithecellobii TaxID=664692 RepID=A0A6N7Z1V1_9PSEU|nr:PDR/VanB family oxidoreductase [Amycolatopsis pithecellobii]MTD52506.1 2Fe-2S iron-sulfur cluster binding domain-containing protein [Amycolatopsis pithecellobii]